MPLSCAALLGGLLSLTAPVWGDGARALVSPERVGNVTEAEAEAFYEGLVEALSQAGVGLVERAQFKTVTNELDLAATAGPAAAAVAYAAAGRKLAAAEVLVPGICKIEHDFILSVRRVALPGGSTRACAASRTRLPARFAAQARLLVGQLFGPASAPATAPVEQDEGLLAAAELRERCRAAGAKAFFPAFWKRAEDILAKADAGEQADPTEHYLLLLQLSARAGAPPEGMVFVPGGYAAVDTSAGRRRLWVEPFFLDRCEVAVAPYAVFLAGGKEVAAYRPITAGHTSFNRPDLPVTGVPWHAAEAFARRCGKRLPTAMEWLRAAGGDDGREFPCGSAEAAAQANLAGAGDGFAVLAPAAVPGRDTGLFGLLGLTGNVREWTASWFADDAYARTAEDRPQDPADGTLRVVLGGSWRTSKDQAACGRLDKAKPGEAFDDVGFRCARSFFAAPAE